MNTEQKTELLRRLAKAQEESSPIILKLGYVKENNQVNDSSIIILDGPPKVWDILQDFEDFYHELGVSIWISPGQGGVKVS